MKVFVYGTLKHGFGNHRLLANSKYLGEAVTAKPYRMLDGGFPVLLESATAQHCIAGELYEVDEATLKRLDSLEGEGSMYDRKTVIVHQPGIDETVQHKTAIYIGCASWHARGIRECTTLDPAGHISWQRHF